jgi:hypothetical protein
MTTQCERPDFERVDKIRQNRCRMEMWTDVIDVTPYPLPDDMHRRYRPWDRHAALHIPVPLWLADMYVDVRMWFRQASKA